MNALRSGICTQMNRFDEAARLSVRPRPAPVVTVPATTATLLVMDRAMQATSDGLRRAVEALGERGRGRPYPKGLRDELMQYLRARRAAGAKLETIGAEIGVPWKTLSRWSGPQRRRKAFRRVEVVAPSAVVTVHGPHGVRIEGLDLDGLAELLRRLG